MSEPAGGPGGLDIERAQAGRRVRLRVLATMLAVLVIAALLTRLPLVSWLIGGAAWAQAAGAWGALAGCVSIAVAMLLLAPVVPLFVLAGWIWGAWGAAVALAAATAAAIAAFSSARTLGRSRFGRLLQRSPRVAYVIGLAERGGLSTVALLRTAPNRSLHHWKRGARAHPAAAARPRGGHSASACFRAPSFTSGSAACFPTHRRSSGAKRRASSSSDAGCCSGCWPRTWW